MATEKGKQGAGFWTSVGTRVAAGIILGIAALVGSWLLGFRPYFIWAWEKVAGGLYWFITASYSVPLWLITLLSGIAFLFTIAIISSYSDRRRLESEEYKTSHTHYRQDTFDDVEWTWEWYGQRVLHLVPTCAKDGTPMVFCSGHVGNFEFGSNTMTYLRCETCSHTTNPIKGDDQFYCERIERQILRKVKTKEFIRLINLN